MNKLLIAGALSLVTVTVVACGAEPENVEEEVTTQHTRVQEIASGRLHTGSSSSLEILMMTYPVAVVGRVESVEDISDPKAAGYEVEPGQSTGADESQTYDPAEDPPQLSRYAFRVERVLAGDVKEGDVLPVVQAGGVRDGVAYESKGDAVIQVGKAYLTFLAQDEKYGWYHSARWGRFELTDDGRIANAVPEWSNLAVPQQLDGQQLDAIFAAIDKAADVAAKHRAEGTLPLLPNPVPFTVVPDSQPR